MKTVYVFGAGASAAVGLPIQWKLIQKIFELTKVDIFQYSPSFMDDSNKAKLVMLYSNFEKSRFLLAKFITDTLISNEITLKHIHIIKHIAGLISSNNYEKDVLSFEDYHFLRLYYDEIKNCDIPLEDIFTILDKAELMKESILHLSIIDIKSVKLALINCIIYTLSFHSEYSLQMDVINKLSKEIIKNISLGSADISIITLNWDTILDQSLFNSCQEYNKENLPIFPDYCFYNYDTDDLLPSTLISAKGLKNIKLMKLHGSLNWLLCSNCGRIYTNFTKMLSLDSFGFDNKQHECKYCIKNSFYYSVQNVMITPTFLKDLGALQLKNVWHNAYIELASANEVIFVGYSLPDADFELKYLLRRSLKPETKIKVVLHETDSPLTYYKKLSLTLKSLDSLKECKIQLPEHRYRAFFQRNEIEFDYNGIEKLNCEV